MMTFGVLAAVYDYNDVAVDVVVVIDSSSRK